MRPNPNVAPADIIPPADFISGRDLLTDQFPHVVVIRRNEDRLAAQREGVVDGRQKAIARNTLEQADVAMALHHNETAQRPNAKTAEREQKKLAALHAERKTIEADFESNMASIPGPQVTVLDDFFNSPAARRAYVHAKTPTDIRDGETTLQANARLVEEFRANVAEDKALDRKALPADQITQVCYEWVHRLASPAMAQVYGSLRRGRVPSAPMDKADSVDALGIIAALMPDELAAALVVKTLEGFDAKQALDPVDKYHKQQALRARRLEIEYATEANLRYALSRGENSGPRISANPLAILDLKEA